MCWLPLPKKITHRDMTCTSVERDVKPQINIVKPIKHEVPQCNISEKYESRRLCPLNGDTITLSIINIIWDEINLVTENLEVLF